MDTQVPVTSGNWSETCNGRDFCSRPQAPVCRVTPTHGQAQVEMAPAPDFPTQGSLPQGQGRGRGAPAAGIVCCLRVVGAALVHRQSQSFSWTDVCVEATAEARPPHRQAHCPSLPVLVHCSALSAEHMLLPRDGASENTCFKFSTSSWRESSRRASMAPDGPGPASGKCHRLPPCSIKYVSSVLRKSDLSKLTDVTEDQRSWPLIGSLKTRAVQVVVGNEFY